MSIKDFRLEQQLRNEAKLNGIQPQITATQARLEELLTVLREIRDALLLTEAEKITRKTAIAAQKERESGTQAAAQEEKDAQAERDAWTTGDRYQ